MTEIEELKLKVLKQDGTPKANASHGDLVRLLELQAETNKAIEVEDYDNLSDLQKEHAKLMKLCYDLDGNVKNSRIATPKRLSRLYVLKDMIEQEPPQISRITKSNLPNGKVEIKVSAGSPVFLEGKSEGQWHTVAQIMSMGGTVKVPINKYSAYRLTRGTNRSQYIEPPISNPNPLNPAKKKERAKK